MGSTKGTTKSGGQKHALDKFYTKPEVAKDCIDKSNILNYKVIIEPSAGSGSFSNQIDNCLAMDLKPESEGIIEQDWFSFSLQKSHGEKILVIGNPPFGKQNNLAVNFINHAAKFADRIAFILPISFKKESLHNRINLNFHLTYEEVLPKNSFTLEGADYDVKCVFQIWDWKENKRVKKSRADLNANNLFEYVKRSDNPDFSIQRIGGRAGKTSAVWQAKSEISNHFARLKSDIDRGNIDSILEKLNLIQYPGKDNAVGPRSISKAEFNEVINRTFPLK